MKLKARKLAGILSAVVLACSMSVTAFAAGSASTSGVVSKSDATATDASGNKVTVSMGEVSAEYAGAVSEVKSKETLKQLLGDSFKEGMSVVDVMDVSVPEGTSFPVTITFNVTGVTADSNVAVLHYNGSAWEVISCKAGAGTVTATFNSLSPVAIVADNASKSGTAAGTGSSSNGATSPKTGETAPIAVMGVIAVLAVAAAYGLKKKEY